jgi:hypothetical protein
MANQPLQSKVNSAIQTGNWQKTDYGPYTQFPAPGTRLRDYWLMWKYDPSARAVMNRLMLTIGAKPGTFTMGEAQPEEATKVSPLERAKRALLGRKQADTRPETQLADWVNGELHRLTMGKTNLYRGLLSAVPMGFMIGQRQWDTSDPRRWRLRCIMPLHPLTMAGMSKANKDAVEIDDFGNLKSVTQFDESGQPHPVDLEQLVYWSVGSTYLEDKYGVSWLEGARRAWYIHTALERFWSIWCERGAYPNVVLQVPKGRTTDQAGGTMDVQNAEYWANVIKESQPGNVIAYETENGFEDKEVVRVINLLINEHAGDAFLQAITYWQSEKYKALSYPVLLLEDPKHSSRAQVQVVLEDWLRCLDGLERELGEIIREQVVQPMVLYNFGEQAAADVMGLGAYHFPSLQQDDLEAIATTIANLAQTGWIQPTQADEDGVRGLFAETGLASPEMAEASRALVVTPAVISPKSEPGALSEAEERYGAYS